MELLERYLHALAQYLPAKSRDIVAELRANLQSRIDDQAQELHRPLNEAEVEGILKEHGHPLLVAMRYHPQRYLIGPALFPVYWRVLKIALPVSAGVFFLVNLILLFARDTPPDTSGVLNIFLRYPGVAFGVASWVTLIFACFDLFAEHVQPGVYSFQSWSPRSLPAVPAEQVGQCLGSVVNVLVRAALLIWLLLIPGRLFLLLGPAAALFDRLPIQVNRNWQLAYWLFVVLFAVNLCTQCLGLFRRITAKQLRRFDLVSEAVGNVLTLVMTFSRPYFLPVGTLDAPTAQRVSILNHWAFIAMLIFVVVGGAVWILRLALPKRTVS